MTAKEYLRQYQYMKRRIESKLRQIESLKLQAQGFGTSYKERVQSSGPHDSMACVVEKYVQMESDLVNEVEKLRLVQTDVKNTIDSLNDNRYKNVLELRYIECLSFEEIAYRLGHTYNYVLKLHGYGLADVKKLKKM